jgi:hypothetical protein
LCDEDHGEGRRPSRRLLQSQAGLLCREVGLLFSRRETCLLSIGPEMLCRKQGLLHGPEITR